MNGSDLPVPNPQPTDPAGSARRSSSRPASPWESTPIENALAVAIGARTRTRRAALVAALAHRGQVDKVGEPYTAHPARVAEAVCAAVGDGEAVQAAFLHDVVEDTEVTLDDLRTFGFSEDVIAAVDALTKRKGESFPAYYERVKANPLALVVKWHDVADNADPARLAKVAPDTRDRLRDKYEQARELLAVCQGCGGTGIGGYVSWEMASDAGEPSMEGQPIPCSCVKPASPRPSMPGAEDGR